MEKLIEVPFVSARVEYITSDPDPTVCVEVCLEDGYCIHLLNPKEIRYSKFHPTEIVRFRFGNHRYVKE
jgi:hypothetical protein